jgi:uncharacterized membrane protein YhfC
MASWLNLLSGAGMIAVGAMAVYLWRRRAPPEYFLFGALFWGAAIGVKIAMDLTVTGPLAKMLPAGLAGALALGAYFGLRTGILESGIAWAAARLTRMRLDFGLAVAVGIGFGAGEAIFLGAASMINVLAYVTVPGLIESLPPETQAAVLEQLTPKFIPVPVIERLFTLLCHVFATALALYAIKDGLRWLALSVALKTALDGALPLFSRYLSPMGFADYLIIEAYVAALGLASLAGLLWLKQRWGGLAHQA